MKTTKKVLLVLCVIIIIIGMFLLGRKGLNYEEGYSKNSLLETAKDYIIYLVATTVITVGYFAARYNKQGVGKVVVTSVLGIVGALVLVLAIIAISTMEVSRIFFPIMLLTYASSILILTAYFEGNN